MGPSVKFVSRINGSFSKTIMGNFFSRKKGQTGRGGSEGGLSKWHNFSVFFFFETLTLYELYSIDRFFCLFLQYISKYNSVFTIQATPERQRNGKKRKEKKVGKTKSDLVLVAAIFTRLGTNWFQRKNLKAKTSDLEYIFEYILIGKYFLLCQI